MILPDERGGSLFGFLRTGNIVNNTQYSTNTYVGQIINSRAVLV